MSTAPALDVCMLDGAHAEWRILSEHPCNVLLEGAVTATDTVLRLIQPHLREPIVSHWPGSPLDLPRGEARALILRDVAALDRDEQRRLLAWMDETGVRTQVITTAACAVFARVAAGLFDASLYYRLNVLLLRVTLPFDCRVMVAKRRVNAEWAIPDEESGTEADRSRALRHLRELIAALDRRAPHIERSGEIGIARDAATLKAKAMERIAQLEAASENSEAL